MKKKTTKKQQKEHRKVFLFLPHYSRLNPPCTRFILLFQSCMLFSSPSASPIHMRPFLTWVISLSF